MEPQPYTGLMDRILRLLNDRKEDQNTSKSDKQGLIAAISALERANLILNSSPLNLAVTRGEARNNERWNRSLNLKEKQFRVSTL